MNKIFFLGVPARFFFFFLPEYDKIHFQNHSFLLLLWCFVSFSQLNNVPIVCKNPKGSTKEAAQVGSFVSAFDDKPTFSNKMQTYI